MSVRVSADVMVFCGARCSGFDSGSYVWHNYKPLSEKLEHLIESVVSAAALLPRARAARALYAALRTCCIREVSSSRGAPCWLCWALQVQDWADKEIVVVTAAYSVHRFLDLRGASVCRDQFLRLTMVRR